VLRLLGRRRVRSTAQLPIGGGAEWPADAPAMDAFLARIEAAGGVSRERAWNLVGRYGTLAHMLAGRFAGTDDRPLQHEPDYSVGELRYLCRETGVVHLADLVVRRTLLAISGRVTDALLAELADVAAEALGWDAARRRRELDACAELLRERHSVALATPGLHHRRTAPYDASLAADSISSALPT
jgi:glycerol-3-phosphate dehydrogenase